MWRPTGGQSVPNFDYYMGPGVAKTFIKELHKVLCIRYPECNGYKQPGEHFLYNDDIKVTLKKMRESDKNGLILHNMNIIRELLHDKYAKGLSDFEVNSCINCAMDYTKDATHQAMEAVVHNLNSMHSRAGRI